MPYEPPSLQSREEWVERGPQHEQWLRTIDGRDMTWKAEDNLSSWIKSCLCLAVRLFDSAADVRAYLERRNVSARYVELATLWPRVRRQTFTGHDPGFAYGAWLLERPDLVPLLLDHTSEIVSTRAISRFWADYHRAIECLSGQAPYRRNLPPKLPGSLLLEARQLALIEALTSGDDDTEAMDAAAAEFARANRDKRLFLNAVTTINPSGLDPVRFDLAMWAIRRASGAVPRAG
jgi:hypothetical protein